MSESKLRDALRAVAAADKTIPADNTALRRMNHREWLEQFSQIMACSPNSQPSAGGSFRGMPMTPFRLGVVSRLQQAAEYVALLEADVLALRARLAAPVPTDGPVDTLDTIIAEVERLRGALRRILSASHEREEGR